MTKPETIRFLLTAGRHPFSVGRVREVAALILAHPKMISQLVEYLWDEDLGVANRAADALERISYHQPALAAPWKDSLLGLLAEAEQKKLRWNLALIVPRLTLTIVECQRAASILRTYLEDKSSIVKTCAMQGLAELTRQDPLLLPETLDLLRILTRTGTPAMRARGRILLKRLERARA
jgi:HEAT repeat protein